MIGFVQVPRALVQITVSSFWEVDATQAMFPRDGCRLNARASIGGRRLAFSPLLGWVGMILVLCALAGVTPITPAVALPFPNLTPASFDVSCVGGLTVVGPGNESCLVNSSTTDGIVFESATANITPVVIAQTSLNTFTGLGGTEVLSNMNYQFTVFGPPNQIVGVIIDAFVDAATSGPAEAGAIISLNGTTLSVCSTVAACSGGNNHLHSTFLFGSNAPFLIGLSAGVGADSGGSAVAFADPVLTIDPSTPNADQFTLVFSPGILNEFPASSSVAAPPTLALVALALACVVRVKRRR